MVQALQFEKTNPAAAYEGRNPSVAAMGVAVPQEKLKTMVAQYHAGFKKGGSSNSVDDQGNSNMSRSGSISGASGRQYAVVIDDFVAEAEGDLELRRGETVEVLEDVDASWSRGRIGNREGIFPKTFVEF
ncbi:hypothetical protein HDU76_013494, partial [Blyttiomyces sp. JEL0837]